MNGPPVFVAAAVIRRSNRFLVCRRPVHKRHGGLYEFPGGKFLRGEGISAAVTRELLEELYVDVTSVGPELFSLADPGSEFVIRFVEVTIDGEPMSSEHDHVKWATVAELNTLSLAPTDTAFVRTYLESR